MSMSTGGYAAASNEEKESGNGFEFTRRKKWPQILLQELVGAAMFCIKPYQIQRGSVDNNARPSNSLGWKIIYVSPCGSEMIGQKSTELENRDFFDLVYPADQSLLQTFFASLLGPDNSTGGGSTSSTSTAGSSKSQTTFARIISSGINGDASRSGPVAWEIRAHATGLDGLPSGFAGAGGYRLDGTVIPRTSGDEGSFKGKAVWVMGRRISSGAPDDVHSLDAFLELKLENEKLREELRELQMEIDDEDYQGSRLYLNPITLDAPSPTSSSPSPSSPSSSSSSASLRQQKEKKKPARPTKDPKDKEREKKRAKKNSGIPSGSNINLNSLTTSNASGSGAGGSGNKEGGEGLHVCVTCGRTDSPEWRKGPLGPKTLCNACGLRWAKRNSTQPSRKERKAAEAAAAAKKAAGS